MKKDFLAIKIKSILVIAPEKFLLKRIVDALNLIKKTDLKEYKNLFSRISVIFVTNLKGGNNMPFFPEKCWFVNKSMIKRDLVYLASVILHEGFHTVQFENGEYTSLSKEKIEKDAIEFQANFLKKLKDYNSIAWIRRCLREKYWIKLLNDRVSQAYFRNLLNLLKVGELKLTYCTNIGGVN